MRPRGRPRGQARPQGLNLCFVVIIFIIGRISIGKGAGLLPRALGYAYDKVVGS